MRKLSSFHHFHLSDALMEASALKDVLSTLNDMRELSLVKLPYSEILVSASMTVFIQKYLKRDEEFLHKFNTFVKPILTRDGDHLFYIVYDKVDWREHPQLGVIPQFSIHPTVFKDGGTGNIFSSNAVESVLIQQMCSFATSLLIVSLAASNAQVSTSVNKRAERGIGHGKFRGPSQSIIYLSTTRISPPVLVQGVGSPKRPHMRRGHIHTYWIGPGRTERLDRFVAPIFVNARDDVEIPAQTYKLNK